MSGRTSLSTRGLVVPLFLLASACAVGYTLVEYRASSGSPPIEPTWGLNENGSPPAAFVSDSILFQGPVSAADTQTWHADAPLDFNNGTSWIEWRMRVASSGWYKTGARWRSGWRLRCVSNARQEYMVGLTSSALVLGDNWDGLDYTELNYVSSALETSSWHTYRLDLTPGMASLSVDGEALLAMAAGPSVHPTVFGRLDFGDGTYHAGSQSELEYLVVGTYGVCINVGLRDWIPSAAGQVVDVDLLDESGTVLLSRSLPIQPDGTIFAPSYPGTMVRARVKASHWLSQTITNLVDPGGDEILSCNLVNGDCDGDNAITVFDYNVLSEAFDSTPSDPNWVPGADLDGDELVTVFDYNILSQGFDLVGD